MPRARKPAPRSDANPYHVQAMHLRDVAGKLDKVLFTFKEIDAQNKTIIILLNKTNDELVRLGNSIDNKIGTRIETLRQDLRKALAVLFCDDNTGDAQKIIRDHMFNRPERKKE